MRIHLFKNYSSLLLRSLFALAAMAAGSVLAQTQGITDTEILLGTVQDLSGPVASIGVPVRDGMILATEDINAAGGILGRKIRLLAEDSSYDPKKGVLVTQKLLSQDNVFALLNTLGSAVTQATQPMSVDRGVPYLFPIAVSDVTYLPYHPLKFALNPLSEDHMRVAVKYAYEKLGKRRFGLLYQDDDMGKSAVHATEAQLKVHGLSLIERSSYKRGDLSFSAQIARLKAANVDIVMLGSNPREVASAEIEAKTQGWPVDMMVPWGVINAVISLGGPAVEGLYGATQMLNSAQPLTPAYKALAERFKARFGHDVTDGVNYGYTATMLFAEGARNAGRNLTGISLSQGLEKVKDYEGVFEAPLISYGPNRHGPPPAAYIMQVRGGKWARIDGPMTY